MYSLMKWYRKYFKYSSGSPFYLSIYTAACKCIENEILGAYILALFALTPNIATIQ